MSKTKVNRLEEIRILCEKIMDTIFQNFNPNLIDSITYEQRTIILSSLINVSSMLIILYCSNNKDTTHNTTEKFCTEIKNTINNYLEKNELST